MAIIKPSKKFAGSEMSSGDGGKYIRPDVRQVLFNKNNNKDGTYLYFLPAYKLDNTGAAGVWFKVITVRDNFGEKFKDKYVVLDANDPVAYFERNFKLLYPEEALVVEETNEKTGRAQKKYPSFGRVTKRVIFNVAYTQELEKGCHVLDLPAYNGANILTKWLEGKDNRGRERPMINDPERCIPVFVKLNDGGGAPWEITPDQTDPAALPDELADSDHIYNLDDIFLRKSNAELIAKLKEWYTLDVVEECMAGYEGFGGAGGVLAKSAANPSVPKETAAAAPAVKRATVKSPIPKVSTKKADTAPAPEAEDDLDMSPTTIETNPMAAISDDEVKAFLQR